LKGAFHVDFLEHVGVMVGYFEGLDAERAIAWRAADLFALREFLGWCCPTRRRTIRRFLTRDA
jgi:hypothetical protein